MENKYYYSLLTEYDGSSGESGSSFAAASSERKPQTRELNTAPEPYYGKVRLIGQISEFLVQEKPKATTRELI